MRNKKREQYSILICVCVLALLIGAGYFYRSFSQPKEEGGLVINEVCSDNFSVICDEGEKYYDFAEIYNGGSTDYKGRLYLSDDEDDVKKYSFYADIPAHGYMLVWLSGKGSSGALHATFGISKEGEFLILCDGAGNPIDEIYVPKLKYNTSYCRREDGQNGFVIKSPTPGASNDPAPEIEMPSGKSPVFSLEDGFYDEGTRLKLFSDLFTTVYYTTDGSVPTTESKKYSGGITLFDASENENVYANEIMYPTYNPPSFKIDKCNVIRAMSVNVFSGKKSDVVTHVYFCGFDNKEDYSGVSVVSLVADPDELFGYERGIFALGEKFDEYKKLAGAEDLDIRDVPASAVNENGEVVHRYEYTNASIYGKDSEREAYLTVFDENHNFVFSQDIGMRIAGESSRYDFQKSMNLFARDIYDEGDSFREPFFAEEEDKVRLRRGENDVIFEEPFVHYAASELGLLFQRNKQTALFINGEYWGVYNLREQYNDLYFRNYFGIEENNLWLIKNGVSEYGGDEALESYTYMKDVILAGECDDPEVYDILCNLVDIDNLIDFFCTMIFFDNEDIDHDHNQMLYREMGGKWRWIIYDMDAVFGDADTNTFELYRETADTMYLPGHLYRNEEFREKFYNRMMELMDNEYSYEALHKKLVGWDEEYRSQNIISLMRYFDMDRDEAEKSYLERLSDIDTFLRDRKQYVKQYLEEDMGMTDE